MRVEHYIKELLYRYNCVVMPEFGAFLAHSASAKLDTSSNTLYPPTKTISFNEQLSKNDGLLVSHISKAKKLSYEDMLEEINTTSKNWKETLQNGDKVVLFGIGTLFLNSEGKVQFNPEEKVNYLTSSFGLASFAATPIIRETLKEAVEELEELIPFIITPEQREKTSFRSYLKYAAVGLVLFSMGISGYQFYNQNQQKQQLVNQNAQEEVSRHIQEATFFDSAPIELPSLHIEINKKEKLKGPLHHVIAGAFRIRDNANKKVAQLKRQGYDASYIGANKYGLHQVSYSSFSDNTEALKLYRKIKRTISPDVWILSEK
ncbi:SPOR domain-containing protein [Croceitalea rosinachiae]|uniref:SPOR domain-containing protein n=1 Tax=Croceitalea rosinachiae TaxID=3075596 RepID=A0ABU3A7P1_9FLAO|nr:SPOR domain-containing protein [Croceitalea sp. F388]MDT0606189.1 SPOR domain-containing protein [Croceitalea sp. F388]